MILACRFYDGTDKDPYDEKLNAHKVDKNHLPPPECMNDEYALPHEEVDRLRAASTARFYESCWVTERLNGKDLLSYVNEYVKNGNKDFEVHDGTPITLKALLWNRYYHFSYFDPASKGFQKWYCNYYSSEPTNREKRAAERRPGLIAKCRFYHGEQECPFEFPKESLPWTWERDWVELLSSSWENSNKIKEEYLHSPVLIPFGHRDIDMARGKAEKLHIPFSLYLYLMLMFAKGYVGGFKHEMEEYFDFWIHDYSKH